MTIDQLWTELATIVPDILAALPVAAAVVFGGLLANIVVGRALLLLARRTHLNDTDLAPARNVLRWLIRIVTIVLVLGVFGFELGGLWAMISTVLAMVAIGFVAVWSLLSNTSATVLLVILRPFHVGDDLELPSENMAGRVVDINFFFTTLITHDGHEWRVPNNLFFQKVTKRKAGLVHYTLAHQLNNPQPAPIEPPPAPIKESDSAAGKSGHQPISASEDFAAKSVPDPGTMMPRR